MTETTKTYYRTGNYEVDHSTFGGEIEIEDFNTYFFHTFAHIFDFVQ